MGIDLLIGEATRERLPDHVTGLAWQGCEPGRSGDDCMTGAATPFDWAGALAYCEGLSWAGATDWHLPDVKQLRSVIDNRRTAPGLDTDIFPNHVTFGGWTSTTNLLDPAQAWIVAIGFGGGIQDLDKSGMTSARCVRTP